MKRCRHVCPSGKKCALKNSFAIAGATRARHAPAQRGENDGHVHMALVVGGEDDRPFEIAQVLASSTRAHAKTRASGRIQVASEQPSDDPHRPRTVPRREVDWFRDLVSGRRLFHELLQIGDAAASENRPSSSRV